MAARRSLLPPPPPRHRADVSLAIINIVLLLIFFFLATGQLASSEDAALDLALTGALPLEALPDPVLVVDEAGALMLDGNPVAPELLGTALADLPLIHVMIPRTTPALELVSLLAQPAFEQIEVRLVTIKVTEGARP